MLNFNVDPYYDDFDPNNNYHRILFKPGRAVQARELTQSQTILQNQITNFADHFFTQNTPVKGGKVTINNNANFLKLNPTFNESDVVASDFVNSVVTDDTGSILAQVIATEEGVENGDPPTLILSYFSGEKFADGANVISTSSSVQATAASVNASGDSSVASIANGVFYIVNGYNYSSIQNPDGTYSRYSTGNFVEVQPQTIILEKYSNKPNSRIGLAISEYVSDYVSDPNLLDPAVGATNYQAPGADRYTIDLELTTRKLTAVGGDDSSFVELTRVENGSIIRQVNGTTYSAIDDYFAKRTYETNGDYVVSNFKITPSSNTDINGSDKYFLEVGAGLAYVQGYRAENQGLLRLNGTRARATSNVNNNIITPAYGNYLYVNTLLGANGSIFDATQSASVDLHVGGVANVITTNTTTYNATVAATANIRSITYSSSGTDSNTKSYIYKTYLFDVTSKALSANAASGTSSTIQFADTTGKFSPKANVYDGVSISITAGPGTGDIRTISGYNGTTKTATVSQPFTTSPTTATQFTLNFGVKDAEALVRAGAGASSNLAIYGTAAINNQSKVNQVTSGDVKLSDTQDPQLIFELGNQYVSSVSDASFTTLQEYRGQAFTVTTGGISRAVTIDSAAQSTLNFFRSGSAEDAETIKQNFIVMVTDPQTNANLAAGDIVHFTNSPTRTVVVNAGKTTATFFAADLLPFTATVFTKVAVIDGDNTSFIKKTKTLVTANTTSLGITGASGTVNTNTLVDLSKGQVYIDSAAAVKGLYQGAQSLYVSDVKRIVKIIDPKGVTPTLAMLSDAAYDVTENYTFNNGQRDSYYGHASITLKPGAPKPNGLWVLFDHYTHGGGDSYFDVGSYVNENYIEIPSYTNSKGITYSLRDCVDFRPSIVNAQADFVFRYSVPPSTSNFYGTLIPIDQASFTSDYSYYLGRKDLVVLTKDAEIQLVEGVPSVTPQFPPEPSNGLVLAKLTHDPYTAYIPGQAAGVVPNLSIVPVQHKNWSMQDISGLQTRINNIEYYSSLNLLEQSTSALQIPDALGLNRFKNGILVDNFSTFGVADTYNENFAASINTKTNTMTAALDVKNFQLQNLSLLDSKNNGLLADASQTALGYRVSKSGRTNVITLPYTQQEVVTQKLASRDVDVNAFSLRNTEGTTELTPPLDNWIDTTTEPSLLFIDPTLKAYKATNSQNLLYLGDWQSIPGTKVTTEEDGYNVTREDKTRVNYYGNYSLSSSEKLNYVQNVSLLPYIRGQQVQFKTSGMLTNTTLNAFFDGKRVTRLVRKANIIEVTGTSGNFKAGDVIGYKPTSTTFVRTGTILDVYKKGTTSPMAVRLYVMNDNDNTSYTSGTLYNARFDGAGTYVESTDSGTIASTVHYAGTLSNSGSSTTSVTLNGKASATTNYYVGMTFNIVGGSELGLTTVAKGSAVTITAYNGTTKVATLSSAISYTAGDVYSIGPIQSNEVGNVCGIFYIPNGYFKTGERIFRLDNRVVTQTATEFVYQKGTETTSAEATFFAQGLTQKVQEAEFSPSYASASKVVSQTQTQNFMIERTAVPTGGGGCCVVATALNARGTWSDGQKNTLIEWCEKHLHNKSLGECFRRGYQVIGSKLLVPGLNNKHTSGYLTWSWDNGTNMVMGKKFNPLSVPNSIFWIGMFMLVGSMVSTRYARKSWMSLYKKD
jgi:hypothetical protein